jgi:hypothetical protein
VIALGVFVGIVLVSVLLAPFFAGPGGLLQSAASINSPEKLAGLKEALLRRYLADEAAFKAGQLSALAWQQRKTFLSNRYIDAARRLDFLEHAPKDGTP